MAEGTLGHEGKGRLCLKKELILKINKVKRVLGVGGHGVGEILEFGK